MDYINRCEELTKPEHANWIGLANQNAIFQLLKSHQELEYKLKEKSV